MFICKFWSFAFSGYAGRKGEIDLRRLCQSLEHGQPVKGNILIYNENAGPGRAALAGIV
jgi:hypothetical protein